MDIKKIRGRIDNIDRELIKVISKRINLLPKVVKFKEKNNLPIINLKREAEVIGNVRTEAKKLSVSEDLAEKILKTLIKESHRIEKVILSKYAK